MFAHFTKALQEGKDKALSLGVKQAVNYKLKEIGEMLKFNLDSERKTIELEILLDGEKETLHVTIHHYAIMQEGDKHFLVAKKIITSRKWMNTMAEQYLAGKKLEIPNEYASMLKLVA